MPVLCQNLACHIDSALLTEPAYFCVLLLSLYVSSTVFSVSLLHVTQWSGSHASYKVVLLSVVTYLYSKGA
jgi:hypothetical protein